MKIYPALDILDGKAVRLASGQFDQIAVYSTDPIEVTRTFEEAGFQYLHVVDLTGARDPEKRQIRLLGELATFTPRLQIQLGGGIRGWNDVQELLDLGIDRIVLGSLALQDPQEVLKILAKLGGERVTLAMDFRTHEAQFEIASSGWLKYAAVNYSDWIRPFLDGGLRRILCTDIQRDGSLGGPNLKFYLELRSHFPELEIQASGGVSSFQDLVHLKETGVHSAVIGKAFYENRITLSEAVALCSQKES